jgi:hypothetical protein
MKKTMLIIVCLAMVLVIAGEVLARRTCQTIPRGEIFYPPGHYLVGPIPDDVDAYGFYYQGHMFVGLMVNYYLGALGYPPYKEDAATYLNENPDVVLLPEWEYRNYSMYMEWNDAFLSNRECNGDGTLDRHLGHRCYKGSGAGFTLHLSQSNPVTPDYLMSNDYQWNNLKKVEAVPAHAVTDGAKWYTRRGVEIGLVYDLYDPLLEGLATVLDIEHNPNPDGSRQILYRSQFFFRP